MKRHSTSFVSREIEIKSIKRYDYVPNRMTDI